MYHAIWNAILNHVANKLLTVSSSYSSKLSQNLDFPPRYADVNQKTIQTSNCICPIASELAQIKCILQQEKHHDKPLPSCIKPHLSQLHIVSSLQTQTALHCSDFWSITQQNHVLDKLDDCQQRNAGENIHFQLSITDAKFIHDGKCGTAVSIISRTEDIQRSHTANEFNRTTQIFSTAK